MLTRKEKDMMLVKLKLGLKMRVVGITKMYEQESQIFTTTYRPNMNKITNFVWCQMMIPVAVEINQTDWNPIFSKVVK